MRLRLTNDMRDLTVERHMMQEVAYGVFVKSARAVSCIVHCDRARPWAYTCAVTGSIFMN